MRWFGLKSFSLLFLLWAVPAFGQIALDQNATNSDLTGGASITTSFTCTTGATLIIVRISTFDYPNVTASVTYNSASGSKRAEGSNIVASQSSAAIIWTVPGSACDSSAHNLVVNFSPNSAFGAYIRIDSVTGSSTTTGNTFGTYSESVTSPYSNSISSSTGSVVFDVTENNCSSLVVGGSQTQDYKTSWGGEPFVAGSHLLNASAMSWTFTGTCGRIAQAGLEVKIAGGGGGGTTIRHRRVQ